MVSKDTDPLVRPTHHAIRHPWPRKGEGVRHFLNVRIFVWKGNHVDSRIVATDLLAESTRRRDIHLSLLVADTGLWVSPDYYRRLLADTGTGALFPRVRRARVGQGEARGQLVGDIRLDDNSYANVAIKRALGLPRGAAVGFEACHIWPLTCYDERYHTLVANIVLIPRALAGLSDHEAEIQRALQYRAFELYEWWPDEQPRPEKPDFYPAEWRDPLPDPATVRKLRPSRERTARGATAETQRTLEGRIRSWAEQPNLNVHKIIAIVASAGDGIERNELVGRVCEATGSKNPYGAVASLTTNAANAYGRVFEVDGKIVRIDPGLAQLVGSLSWDSADR